MKKATKVAMNIVNKILAFVYPIILIFFASMMIGQSLPAWSATAILWTGWVVMVFGIIALIYAVFNIST